MPALAFSRPDVSSRERIDAAALKLLALHGYDGFSMQTLADVVGLHKSTLFHHYKGKAELANHIISSVLAELGALTRAHLHPDAPSLEDFEALARDLVDYFSAHPDAARLLLHVVLAPGTSPLHFAVDPNHPLVVLMSTLVAWFEAARRAGAIRWVRIRHTLMDLFGVIVFHPAAALQMPYIAGPEPFSPDEIAKRRDEVAALVRQALAPTSAPTV